MGSAMGELFYTCVAPLAWQSLCHCQTIRCLCVVCGQTRAASTENLAVTLEVAGQLLMHAVQLCYYPNTDTFLLLSKTDSHKAVNKQVRRKSCWTAKSPGFTCPYGAEVP